MKEKYYSFDGKKLNFLGEFCSADEAADYAEKHQMNFVFYVASMSEWKEFINNCSQSFGQSLKESDEKEEKETNRIIDAWASAI